MNYNDLSGYRKRSLTQPQAMAGGKLSAMSGETEHTGFVTDWCMGEKLQEKKEPVITRKKSFNFFF